MRGVRADVPVSVSVSVFRARGPSGAGRNSAPARTRRPRPSSDPIAISAPSADSNVVREHFPREMTVYRPRPEQAGGVEQLLSVADSPGQCGCEI